MAHVAFVFQAQDGGVQRTQVILANALRERGLTVSVVMPRARGPFLAQLRDGVEVVDLGASSHLSFIVRLAGYLRRHGPDRVLASQHHTGVFFIIAKLLVRCSARVVVVIHNNLTNLMTRERFGWLMIVLMRFFYRWADAVVGVSQGVVEDLAQRLPGITEKLTVVYNPVPITEIQEQGSVEPCGEPWLDKKTMPVFVAVGRPTPQKDFPTLLRAFAIVIRELPCRLVVIGAGEGAGLRSFLAELAIEDAVRILGHRSNPYGFMSKADAVVVSSRWEGFCLVVVEALALGVPVISTDCQSGPAEILDDGRYGRLVPVADPDELATAMRQLVRGEVRFSPAMLRERAAFFAVDKSVLRYLRLLGLTSP